MLIECPHGFPERGDWGALGPAAKVVPRDERQPDA